MKERKRLTDRADAYLASRPRNAVVGIALLIAVLVGGLQALLPVDLVVLFLLPILVAAWYGGRRAGFLVAVYCASSAFVLQTLRAGPWQTPGWDQIVNLVIRFVTYIAIARLAGGLQESRRRSKELTGFIVHDLRSPISSAITGLQTLETLDDGMDDLQREMVALALVSNQRALTLVNAMLDLDKLDSGQMEVRPEALDASDFLKTTTDQVALWAQGSEIAIRCRHEGVSRLWADPDLTSRVIVNLLSNALKFSPPGAEVEVTVEPAHGALRFGVHDRGPGIPPEFAETIFEPFAQVKGTKGGTGLGLTFCRLAVQAQGGKIWCEPRPGGGTSMLFTLPEGG